MSTIIRTVSAADFVATVPHLLGFHPRQSLVLVPFAGTRSLGALRVDLPSPLLDDDEFARTASTVIGLVCKVARADGVAVLVYCDAAVSEAVPLPHGDLVDAVVRRADICGLRVVDTVAVSGDRWNRYGSPTDGGHALTAPESIDDLAGFAVEGDQAAAARLPPVSDGEARRVGRLLSDLDAFLGSAPPSRSVSARRRRAAWRMAADLADPPLLFETLVGESPDALGPHELALLAFCLGRPLLRDVALVQWAAGLSAGDAAYQAQIRYTEGEPLPDDVGRTMIGEGPRPDTSRLEAALELCRRAAAAAPSESRPGALAACAWISWALGRSTHAAHYVEQALGIDPHHGLSTVVAALVEHSRLPEWAFARPAEAAPTVTSQAEKGSSLGSRGR